jgi:hypothetical protein
MARFFVLRQLLLILALPFHNIALAHAPDRGNQQSPDNHSFFTSEFVAAGFPPVVPSQDVPVAFFRLLVFDPYVMLPVPSIGIDKLGDGRILMTVYHRGWKATPVALTPATWERLQQADASDQAALANADGPSSSTSRRSASVCHAWSTVTQKETGAIVSWHGCSGAEQPSLAVAIMEIAVATRPDCQPTDSVFERYSRCLAAARTLDDPDLDREFSALILASNGEDGSVILANARVALRHPNARLGNAEWQAAREAIEQHGRINASRQHRLDGMANLLGRAERSTAADKARISAVVANWRSFLIGQERNHIDLLERLSRIAPP